MVTSSTEEQPGKRTRLVAFIPSEYACINMHSCLDAGVAGDGNLSVHAPVSDARILVDSSLCLVTRANVA